MTIIFLFFLYNISISFTEVYLHGPSPKYRVLSTVSEFSYRRVESSKHTKRVITDSNSERQDSKSDHRPHSTRGIERAKRVN